MSDFDPASIRALVFDVFGTVVDWRGSIVREGEALSAAKGRDVDWRASPMPGGRVISRRWRVRCAARSWANIDTLHRGILDEIGRASASAI
jgi:2-haloacid dehalogenase